MKDKFTNLKKTISTPLLKTVFEKKYKTLKSPDTVDEINKRSQERLEKRRKEDALKYRQLFGK